MSEYKFIVFDWDGTLMDSAQKIVSCMRVAIERAGLPERTDDQMRHIIGLGMHEAIERLFPEQQVDIARLAAEYRDEFISLNQTPSPLYEGVHELLECLEDRGYWLAVATGKSRTGLDHVLAEVGLKQRFHATRTADETASKPHPLMLNELMQECGFSAAETLMVGDTEFDLEMAHAAGVAPVAVRGGAHPVEHLSQFRPLTILDRISDLIHWLETEQPARA